MGLIEIKVDDLVPDFLKYSSKQRQFQHVYQALEYLSTMYQQVWIEATLGNQLDRLPFSIHSTNYQRTIRRERISPVLWIVYSDYTSKSGQNVTLLLEQGHGLIDLKDGLLRGIKSRQSKSGGRYNIVPFRHGTPGSDQHRSNPMPISIYYQMRNLMKKADQERALGISNKGGSSIRGQTKTEWGVRLEGVSRGLRSKLITTKKQGRIGTYTWKASKYEGMVALQQSTTRSLRHGYMTFRVVSSKSDPMSWIVPEQPPFPIRDAVIAFMEPYAKQILEEALLEDIK